IAALPVLDRITVGGAPVSWLVLAVATYPVLLLLALGHVRLVERVERGAAAGRSGSGPGSGAGGGR
ncbi:MAG TPA: hypothetical protein VFY14_10835, partial [Streptomyces sp.]|nr:hypothetical protein [Streptomyces sp.]